MIFLSLEMAYFCKLCAAFLSQPCRHLKNAEFLFEVVIEWTFYMYN